MHCENGRRGEAGTPVVRRIPFSFFFLIGKIDEEDRFSSQPQKKKKEKKKRINSRFAPSFEFVDGSFVNRVN